MQILDSVMDACPQIPWECNVDKRADIVTKYLQHAQLQGFREAQKKAHQTLHLRWHAESPQSSGALEGATCAA